ncbi:hypothetical protein I314_03032 [Cryptococcus bacillisporus CA1873]|uniref:Uncharacterized protein n=2 Tax=Cryptococcus gattii TaxID=552467 RepID=A0A0D0UHZ3_CRYGA|nr:hypothetical protein I312_03011 [Cryptococcus bacillisporus CA1280]KIR63627.1 hypothetical protein I314_03032 [Cryptococcus bacillisporus CA1873]|eukprot:KIR63627.1 hypothetical protein I314_03032 [Cryptococcus gattii CA1873]
MRKIQEISQGAPASHRKGNARLHRRIWSQKKTATTGTKLTTLLILELSEETDAKSYNISFTGTVMLCTRERGRTRMVLEETTVHSFKNFIKRIPENQGSCPLPSERK